MAFTRPDLPTLIERVKTDIKGGLGITTVLRRSFVGVISRALAGLSHLLHGHLDFIADQIFADTAELEFLERIASIWGITRNEATFAELDVTITGNSGGVVPAGTLYQRGDGVQYALDTEVTIPVGLSIVGKVIAQDAGDNPNMAVADVISLISPIANVDGDATVSAVVVEAEDTESDASLRSRLITRIQLPPLGGSANDYIVWAKEVPGVTRSWVLPNHLGAGTVGVSFVEDDDPVSIIPDAAKITEVTDYIESPSRKPVTADLSVFAPTEAATLFDISITPNNTTVQAAIAAELADLFKVDAALAGAFKNAAETHDGKIKLSKIRTAIGVATGIEDFLINTIDAVAPADVVPATGELATFKASDVTWSAL